MSWWLRHIFHCGSYIIRASFWINSKTTEYREILHTGTSWHAIKKLRLAPFQLEGIRPGSDKSWELSFIKWRICAYHDLQVWKAWMTCWTRDWIEKTTQFKNPFDNPDHLSMFGQPDHSAHGEQDGLIDKRGLRDRFWKSLPIRTDWFWWGILSRFVCPPNPRRAVVFKFQISPSVQSNFFYITRLSPSKTFLISQMPCACSL